VTRPRRSDTNRIFTKHIPDCATSVGVFKQGCIAYAAFAFCNSKDQYQRKQATKILRGRLTSKGRLRDTSRVLGTRIIKDADPFETLLLPLVEIVEQHTVRFVALHDSDNGTIKGRLLRVHDEWVTLKIGGSGSFDFKANSNELTVTKIRRNTDIIIEAARQHLNTVNAAAESFREASTVVGQSRCDGRHGDGENGTHPPSQDKPKGQLACDLITEGREARTNGEFDLAFERFRTAIEIDSTNAVAWSERGALMLGSNFYSGALRDFTEAIRLDPRRPLFYSRRAQAFLAKGESEAAARDVARSDELSKLDTSTEIPQGEELAQALPDPEERSCNF